MAAKDIAKKGARQLLHLVFGGELTMLDRIEFSDLNKLDIVGIYPNYAQAYDAWKDAAHRTVDDAHMRFTSSCICTGCSIPSTTPRRGLNSKIRQAGFSS